MYVGAGLQPGAPFVQVTGHSFILPRGMFCPESQRAAPLVHFLISCRGGACPARRQPRNVLTIEAGPLPTSFRSLFSRAAGKPHHQGRSRRGLLLSVLTQTPQPVAPFVQVTGHSFTFQIVPMAPQRKHYANTSLFDYPRVSECRRFGTQPDLLDLRDSCQL